MTHPILLVHPPCADGPPMYYGPPYGIALIAACLEERGHTVHCLDLERSSRDDAIAACLSLVQERGVRTVGIGGTTSSRGHVAALVAALRAAQGDLNIVLGGPFATELCDPLLGSLPVDAIVLGDGEQTLPDLVEALAEGRTIAEVAGVAFRGAGGVQRTAERERLHDLDRLPYPAFHLFEVRESLDTHRDFLATELGHRQLQSARSKRCTSIPNGLMLLSSVGCPYGCVFCPMSAVHGRGRYREHSPAYFVDMLAHFATCYHQRHFVFGDNVFACNRQRTLAICADIQQRQLDLEWTCMARTDQVDRELLEQMRAAGCIEIVFGVESCAASIQEGIGKRLELGTVAPAIADCERAGVRSVVSLMVGNPGESEQTVRETLRAVRHLSPDVAQVKITKLYPGTVLHERSEAAGEIPSDFYLQDRIEPLDYSLDHDGPTLRKLASWIGLRRLLVTTSTLHSPVPAGASPAAVEERPLEALRDDLLTVIRRCHTLRFGRGSAPRGDFLELLQFTRDLHVPQIELETDARVFAKAGYGAELAAGGVDRFVVEFPHRYDPRAGVKGSGPTALAGLDRLLVLSPAQVRAQLWLTPESIETLVDTVAFLRDRSVQDFAFRYAPTEPSWVVSAERIAAALGPAMELLESRAPGEPVGITISGLPACTLPEHAAAIDDLLRPFDEALDWDGQLINLGQRRRKQRQQTADCADCPFALDCEGFWLVDLS